MYACVLIHTYTLIFPKPLENWDIISKYISVFFLQKDVFVYHTTVIKTRKLNSQLGQLSDLIQILPVAVIMPLMEGVGGNPDYVLCSLVMSL